MLLNIVIICIVPNETQTKNRHVQVFTKNVLPQRAFQNHTSMRGKLVDSKKIQ